MLILVDGRHIWADRPFLITQPHFNGGDMAFEVAFGVAVLMLAGAVVVLFSMFGELAARTGAQMNTSTAAPLMRPIESAPVGRSPSFFPVGPVQSVATSDFGGVIVLSTSCKTCEDVATHFPNELGRAADAVGDRIVVVVSSPNTGIGRDFAIRHGLDAVPHWIDEGGRWLRQEVGIDISPAYLLFSRGVLRSALTFSNASALSQAVKNIPRDPIAL
jgi:hypothetical protein